VKARARSGESLFLNQVKHEHSKLYTAARCHCGSWKAAVKAAGFDYEKIRHAAMSEGSKRPARKRKK
jgi:hypothetical protein